MIRNIYRMNKMIRFLSDWLQIKKKNIEIVSDIGSRIWISTAVFFSKPIRMVLFAEWQRYEFAHQLSTHTSQTGGMGSNSRVIDQIVQNEWKIAGYSQLYLHKTHGTPHSTDVKRKNCGIIKLNSTNYWRW